jgi:hypothetical protein
MSVLRLSPATAMDKPVRIRLGKSQVVLRSPGVAASLVDLVNHIILAAVWTSLDHSITPSDEYSSDFYGVGASSIVAKYPELFVL